MERVAGMRGQERLPWGATLETLEALAREAYPSQGDLEKGLSMGDVLDEAQASQCKVCPWYRSCILPMRPLRLDLHTHCREAIDIGGGGYSDLEAAQRIVEAVKRKALDGIAITDHYQSDFAFRIKKLVEDELGNEVLIIPGQENEWRFRHLVELYLPDGSTFRFIPHPYGADWPNLEGIHGIEIENGGYYINQGDVREFGERHNLLLLSNSDAHSLLDIGRHYNEIQLAALCHRAQRNGEPTERHRGEPPGPKGRL